MEWRSGPLKFCETIPWNMCKWCDQVSEKIENAPACKCCQNKNSSELCKKKIIYWQNLSKPTRKNKISEKLSKIDWIAKIYGKLMFKICIIFKFIFKKMCPRMSFNLKKIIFEFFTLISWSENEIDYYFFAPFTHIWSHSALRL